MTKPPNAADAKAICAHLGIETRTVTDGTGQSHILVDEEGMRRLADSALIGRAAAHAFVDQLLAAARDAYEERPAAGACPWCWGSHGCDLPTGHDGDHECRIGHVDVGDEPDTRPRGHADVFHCATGELEPREAR